MRIVREGAEKLYRLTMDDFPADKEARFSYFYRCDFGPPKGQPGHLDLTGFKLDYVDFIECKGAPNLTDVSDRGVISRLSDFTGALFGDKVNIWIHDWIEAMDRAYIASARNPLYAEIIKSVADSIHHNYRAGWCNAYGAAVNRYGVKDTLAAGRDYVAVYPGFQAIWDSLEQTDPYSGLCQKLIPEVAPRFGVRTNEGRIHIQVSDVAELQAVAPTRDRWWLARATEKYLDRTQPDAAPWRAVWHQLDPVPLRQIRPASQVREEMRDRWDWWA